MADRIPDLVFLAEISPTRSTLRTIDSLGKLFDRAISEADDLLALLGLSLSEIASRFSDPIAYDSQEKRLRSGLRATLSIIETVIDREFPGRDDPGMRGDANYRSFMKPDARLVESPTELSHLLFGQVRGLHVLRGRIDAARPTVLGQLQEAIERARCFASDFIRQQIASLYGLSAPTPCPAGVPIRPRGELERSDTEGMLAVGDFPIEMVVDTGATVRNVLLASGSDAEHAADEFSDASEEAIPESAVLSETLTLLRAESDEIASAAFDAYSDAMGNAVETGRFSAAGIGTAMKVSVKQSLLSIGQQASIKGAFEVAEGVSSYADHDSEGGGKHMAAAGKWFAVAGLAGASAAAVGGGEGGGGGGAKDRKRDEVAPNGVNPEGSGGGKGRVIQRITVIGNPSEGQKGEINGKLGPSARRSAP